MTATSATLWIAHRGASHLAPENTLAAIDLAWQQDADAVEIDVRLTRDQRLVLMHDPRTGRTCDRDLAVAQADFRELCELDAGAGKGARWSQEPIPLLAQVLTGLPPGKLLLIEIESGPETIPPMAALLRASARASQQVTLIAFSREVLATAGELLPGINRYWLADLDAENAPGLEEWIGEARKTGFQGLDLRAGPGLDARAIDAIHQAGLGVYAWTVDDPERAGTLVAAGVDGITSNRVAWLRAQLS